VHLACGLVVAMDSDPDQRSQLIARLFAMATARCEDAATTAAICQGRVSDERLLEGARDFRSIAEELITLGLAIELLLAPGATS
jgi:hypothetical protein